jgi:hypothetical protein
MKMKCIRAVGAAILLALLSLGGAVAQGVQPNGLDTYSCNKAAIYDSSNSGATQMIAAGQGPVLICGYSIFAGGTVSAGFVYGTGTNCATNQTSITPAYQLIAQTGMVDDSVFFRGLTAPSGKAVCLNTNSGVAVQAIIYYAQ